MNEPLYYTIILADDEPPALRKLTRWLMEDPECRIVASCTDGLETRAAFRQNPPDILLLDIEMPGITGIQLLDEFPPGKQPVTIFITAHAQYALLAYERAAIAYLLKPYDKPRLTEALSRAKAQVSGRRLLELPIKTNTKWVTRLAVPTKNKEVQFIPATEIFAFQSDGNYVWTHLATRKHLMRDTLSGLEQRLDPSIFIRTHRGVLVNLNFIEALQPVSHGDYLIRLENGLKLPLSRTHREEVVLRLDALN